MCAGRSHAVCDALLWQLREAHTGSLALCPTSSPERARCAGMHGGGASVCTCVYKTRVRAMGSHRRPGAGGQGSSFFHVNASPTILSLIQGASREVTAAGTAASTAAPPTRTHSSDWLATCSPDGPAAAQRRAAVCGWHSGARGQWLRIGRQASGAKRHSQSFAEAARAAPAPGPN